MQSEVIPKSVRAGADEVIQTAGVKWWLPNSMDEEHVRRDNVHRGHATG